MGRFSLDIFKSQVEQSMDLLLSKFLINKKWDNNNDALHYSPNSINKTIITQKTLYDFFNYDNVTINDTLISYIKQYQPMLLTTINNPYHSLIKLLCLAEYSLIEYHLATVIAQYIIHYYSYEIYQTFITYCQQIISFNTNEIELLQNINNDNNVKYDANQEHFLLFALHIYITLNDIPISSSLGQFILTSFIKFYLFEQYQLYNQIAIYSQLYGQENYNPLLTLWNYNRMITNPNNSILAIIYTDLLYQLYQQLDLIDIIQLLSQAKNYFHFDLIINIQSSLILSINSNHNHSSYIKQYHNLQLMNIEEDVFIHLTSLEKIIYMKYYLIHFNTIIQQLLSSDSDNIIEIMLQLYQLISKNMVWYEWLTLQIIPQQEDNVSSIDMNQLLQQIIMKYNQVTSQKQQQQEAAKAEEEEEEEKTRKTRKTR